MYVMEEPHAGLSLTIIGQSLYLENSLHQEDKTVRVVIENVRLH